MEGGDQLVVSECERGGEVAVCDGEHFHQHAIARGGVGQVCNGVNSFLSIYMVGGLVVNMIDGVVAGTCGDSLRLVQFLVGGGKKIELGPGLICWILLFPLLAIVVEHSSLEY